MTTATGGLSTARGRRRAAALLIALGPERAAEILRGLPEEDIGQLTWEIVGIGQLSAADREEILAHFYESATGRDFVSIGGLKYAQDMLEKAVGRERADEITSRLGKHAGSKPFTFLQQVDTKDLVNFMTGEHPQAIALVLAYLPPDKASEILSSLPDEQQAEISVRIAMMERTAPEVIQEVEEAFRARLGTVFSPRTELTAAGGLDSVVELLRKVDLATEKSILDGLEQADPETANEIRKRMFVFENITLLDDRSIQRVLREVDGKDLGLALKGAMDEVKQRILANMSERAARMLEEDMAALGPVRLKQVEEAQGRIVAVIRRLEEAEEIFVMRGGEEDMLVSARHHLRAARSADTVTLDENGQLVTGFAAGVLDEAAATATAEGADIVSAAHERAEHLVREATLEAASIRHEAYAEGREEGARDGVALARAELTDQMALLQRALQESKSIRDRLLWAAEQEIIELVLTATRTVVGEHARLDPALTVETVERALDRAGSQNVVAIRIHPERHALIEAHLTEMHGTPPAFELRADEAIAIGGCVIDTQSGQVDARLDVQLDEIARLLRDALPSVPEPEELAA